MVSPPPPSLDLYLGLPSIFAYPSCESAGKLAALINKDIETELKGTPASLDALLSTISKQLLLSSFGHRESIDDYVNLMVFTALLINSKPVDAGIVADEGGRNPHKPTILYPTSGPALLGKNLAYVLSDELRIATSRSRTPVEEWDRAKPLEYYYKAMIHATVLARAFALTDIFRDLLWSNIEDIFVKGLFSGDEPEPGIFIVLASILLGAGKEIEEYMGDEDEGGGKSWSGHDNAGAKCDESRCWKDVIKALKWKFEQRMPDRLPEYVKDSMKLAKIHVKDGNPACSWDSKRLALEAFNWAITDLGKLGT